MLCALYISCEEEAHTGAVTEKTDAPVDKEAASGYVTSLGMIRGGYNHLGKRKNIWNHSMFWIGEEFKNWNSWNWSWQHRWAWYSIISWEPSGITYHFYTRVCFLVSKFQTRHQMLLWSPGVLLCWLIFSHKMTSRHFRSKGFVPPENLSKSDSPNKLPEFSETYEPYWTIGDVLADLQARTPGKSTLSISVMRNSLRTGIATVS